MNGNGNRQNFFILYWKQLLFVGTVIWWVASANASLRSIKKDQTRIATTLSKVQLQVETIRFEGVDDRYRASDARRDFGRVEEKLDTLSERVSKLEATIKNGN